jgi:hypothetical protein
MLMRIHVEEPGRKPLRLWLPVFLAWVLLLPVLLLLLPAVIVLALLYPVLPFSKKILKAFPIVWEILCLLRETRIDVDRENKKLFLAFK